MPTSSLPPFFTAATPHRLSVLKALWPVIAGEALANHSEVVGIQGDVMRVRADSRSWLKTLRDLTGTLVIRLQRAAGGMAPRALAFVEGPVTPRARQRKAPRRLPPPEARAAAPWIVESAKAVPTEEGRAAYLRAVSAFERRFGATRPPRG